MPVMNGYIAAKQIKASGPGKNTAIIALTASITEEEYATAFAAGYDNLLRKPFKETDIFTMIQRHLGVSLRPERGGDADSRQQKDPCPDEINTILTPEALAALPKEWREELYYVSRVFELNLAKRVIERIRENNQSLANALETLVYNYEFERMRELCEQAIAVVSDSSSVAGVSKQ